SLAAALCSPFAASAAGFALEEGSARGNVTPGELTAGGGEPASLYFNAATITDLPGTQVQAGASLIKPWADVLTVNPYTGQRDIGHGHSKVWTLPSAYATHQLNDSLWLGFGVFTRYGLGAEFPQTWAGRYSSYKAEILSIDASPQLAWKATDSLSLSIGLSLRYFDIELAQKIDAAGLYGLRPYNNPSYSPYDIDQDLHGDDIRPGLDLGLSWKATDTLTLGAAYHSRMQFKVRGDAKWRKPPAVNAMAPAYFENCAFNSRNWNPDKFMAGAAWDATDRLHLSAGATFTTWHLYDGLLIKLDHDMVPGRSELTSEKDWHDTWRLSAGAAYDLSDALTLRAGYTWDQSPINGSKADYLVPGDDRNIFALGLAWTRGAWTLDCSYFYEIVKDFTVAGHPAHGVYDGKYQDASGHCVALSVTRRF
ncbi:MAG: TonB-dependent receptor, partial [Kiritimatiellae bacterium]|nr:TonB-dependent receptor [Kiritimatiellia bacterium]